MTMRFGDRAPARRLAVAALAASLLLVGGCADEDPAEGEASSSASVADEATPALDAIEESPEVAEGESPASPAAPTTAPSTDPSADAIAGAAAGDRAALEQVLGVAADPVTGVPLAELEPLADALPTSWTRNSRGVEVRLDEAALLACANNQFAWVDLRSQNADGAAAWLGVAAVRADQSLVAEVMSAANALAAASLDPGSAQAVVDEFLAVCTERGFEV